MGIFVLKVLFSRSTRLARPGGRERVDRGGRGAVSSGWRASKYVLLRLCASACLVTPATLCLKV